MTDRSVEADMATQRQPKHRGLTILEVLISIGVAAVGLLGALALIPLATNLAQQGLDSDAKATLGTSSVATFEIYAMNRPDRWLYADSTTVQDSSSYSYPPYIPPLQGFVIDPRFVNRHQLTSGGVSTRNSAIFPYVIDRQANGEPAGPSTALVGNEIGRRLYRVSLSNVQGALNADAVFSTADDLVFQSGSSEESPRPIYDYSPGLDGEWGVQNTDDDNDGFVDNPSEAGFPGSDDFELRRQARGEMSWIAMVVPEIVDRGRDVAWGTAGLDDDGDGNTDDISEYLNPASDDRSVRVYTLYIIVMADRDVAFVQSTDSERIAAVAQFYGGGDIRIEADEATEGGRLADVEVNEGDWVMLTKMMAVDSDTPDGLATTDIVQPVVAWYRVIRSADPVITGTAAAGDRVFARDITLEGPGWNPDQTPDPRTVTSHRLLTGSVSNYETQVVVMPDVVAVYQKTIKLDLSN